MGSEMVEAWWNRSKEVPHPYAVVFGADLEFY
jgi:hypothetical protein